MSISRVCVVGPGAIGGMMAVKMAHAGYDVSALVRANRVESINRDGLTLFDGQETLHSFLKAASSPEGIGSQDLVVLTVKEMFLKDVAPSIKPLLGQGSQVVQVTNGIPWWFFSSFGGSMQGTNLESVDKNHCVSRHFELKQHIGGVINCGVSVREDGVICHDHSNQLYLGRPDNDPAGIAEIVDVFLAAGYNTQIAKNIHQQVITKLISNLSFNPVSALTMATLDILQEDVLAVEILTGLMNEGRAVAAALRLDPGPDPKEFFAPGRSFPKSKTSMLQDMEKGKPIELAAILGATVEVSSMLGVSVPLTRTVWGLLCLREQMASRLVSK